MTELKDFDRDGDVDEADVKIAIMLGLLEDDQVKAALAGLAKPRPVGETDPDTKTEPAPTPPPGSNVVTVKVERGEPDARGNPIIHYWVKYIPPTR